MENRVLDLIPGFGEVVLRKKAGLTARVSVSKGAAGFSSFMRGRLAEDVALYVQRIDAHCAVPQHLAAVSSLDRCYHVAPPKKAIAMRRALAYAGFYFHHLEELFLSRAGGSDGTSGLISTDESILAGDAFSAVTLSQELITLLGGREITPERGIPGGLSSGINDEGIDQAKRNASQLLSFALRAEEAFRASGAAWVKVQDLTVPAYSLATVDKDSAVSLYDGDLCIVDERGKEWAKGEASDILPKLLSWKEDLPLRVGPLARLNVGKISTSQARSLQEKMFDTLGRPPLHLVAVGHWQTVIELVQASELLAQALSEVESGNSGITSPLGKPDEGIAAIEGGNGTTVHRYVLDEQGIVQEAQVFLPRQVQAGSINAALASVIGSDDEVSETTIERIADVIRANRPAFVPTAVLPLRVTLRDEEGKVSQEWRRP